jgi:hypothetical protein
MGGYRRIRLLASLRVRVRPIVWTGVVLVLVLVLEAAVAAIGEAVARCWSRLVLCRVDVPAGQS